ncbi:hypothetical protein GO984_03165 [Rhodobacteraceae bacterium CY05]|uniref:Uncharacterized protein n=1 Tax=Parasedimentitalea huanghaiensis TaxID=2682100 RepID=A0A6L6WB74_9RHOB|nr:hypothetical protein [Zongyanglinia huanghaiensis]
MRLCLLCCVLLLSGCGRDPVVITPPPPPVPPDLLQPCSGYTGPKPSTEGQWIDAAGAEMRGRHCANDRLETIAEILKPTGPR